MLMQIIMHVSSAHTSALHDSFYAIDLHAHVCIYVSEMKNVSYQVHTAHMFSQV